MHILYANTVLFLDKGLKFMKIKLNGYHRVPGPTPLEPLTRVVYFRLYFSLLFELIKNIPHKTLLY